MHLWIKLGLQGCSPFFISLVNLPTVENEPTSGVLSVLQTILQAVVIFVITAVIGCNHN